MNKLMLTAFAFVLGLSVFWNMPVSAEEPMNDVQQEQAIELTDKQVKKLDKLYKKMFKQHEAIIKKYVEYGVLSEDQAEKKLEYLEKHYEKMKENRFLPKRNYDKKKRDQMREPDQQQSPNAN
ncbi:DUF2680 domain-containing protein [Bacillus sp. HMF5848]|uniref:DUF2680 domain-containing protein n=1 Tax=Bacillus sp. HMF5848 TaxID=2495421 RepID=UPI000F790EE0|nr:DUF2680 domain-containing protein [Bacillus sp. HMF5848]RSK28481.1 DUF2680 domain-containing protein [Bacillus sp. HMF5848]